MKKTIVTILLLLALAFPSLAVSAGSLPDIPEDKLLDALKSSMPPAYYPDCEFFGAGYYYLGQETAGLTRRVFMAASVAGYGFMGDAFVMQSGWGGPCTAVFELRGDIWRFKELLEAESWNDVHTIMSAFAVKKWQALEDTGFIGEVIRRQAREYLNSIGRPEEIHDYGEMDFALPGVFVPASNLLISSFNDYPIHLTVRERLDRQDGQRYLYTRTWQPDPDGPENPKITTKYGEDELEGRPGVQTLTKTRKSDGKVLETIVITAELKRLSVFMEDEWGSAHYVFPFDPWEITYQKPAVTREGFCRVDTRGLDRAVEGLPGEKQSQAVEEASVTVREDERFAVYQDGSLNTLVYSRMTGGQWREVWRNDRLLPRTNLQIRLSAHPAEEPSLLEMPRSSLMCLSGLSIYAGEEHPELAIELFVNERDAWQVRLYDWAGEGLFARLFEDGIFINFDTFTAHSVGGFVFASVNSDAAVFDAHTIFTFREALNADLEGAPRLFSAFLDAEPMYINLKKDARLPVFLTPDLKGIRAGEGKATVSLKDWVIILARKDCAMCVLYETTPGSFRVGWVDAGADPQLKRLLDIAMPARFEDGKQGVTLRKTALFDDPLHLAGTIISLKKDEQLRVLSEGQDACYVEAVRQGKRFWGFVKAEDVRLTD